MNKLDTALLHTLSKLDKQASSPKPATDNPQASTHKEWLDKGLKGVTKMHQDENYRKKVSRGLA